MRQLLDLYGRILDAGGPGQLESNRTGIDTITTIGDMVKFDLREGFPAATTKELAWESVVGELVGFLRGYTSAADFRALGCNVWNRNANKHNVDILGNHVENGWLSNPNRKGEDDLGRIYGTQWRDYRGINGVGDVVHIDQIARALQTVRHDPESRRILVSAWNPAEIDQAALPACHIGFQLLPRSDGTLHMTVQMRSVDTFLGLPYNIASYAALLELFAMWTGREAATLTMFMSDVHIYVDHIEQVKLQMSRTPYEAPVLRMSIGGFPSEYTVAPLDELLDWLQPEHLTLGDYHHHPAIYGKMAG